MFFFFISNYRRNYNWSLLGLFCFNKIFKQWSWRINTQIICVKNKLKNIFILSKSMSFSNFWSTILKVDKHTVKLKRTVEWNVVYKGNRTISFISNWYKEIRFEHLILVTLRDVYFFLIMLHLLVKKKNWLGGIKTS